MSDFIFTKCFVKERGEVPVVQWLGLCSHCQGQGSSSWWGS